MPCHGIFLIDSFSIWKILDDVVKYSMTWHGLVCHITYIFFRINNGLLTLDMGLANRILKCNLMWRFEDKRKQKHAFHHPWFNQYSKCLRLLEKLYKIFRTIEMGGNYMVEKYLMKLNSQNLSIFAKMCWNGQGTMILYMRQYTWKHVMSVKSSIVSIGLNGN
jgi:hypothetical protein